MNLAQYKSLGVLNRTPNSFSDSGLSLNPEYFKTQLKKFLADPTVIVDVGFESTAPMNEAVSHEVELERFESFLKASKGFSFADRFISFDTYKTENFLVMAREFKKIHPRASIIFNDVGGVLDEDLKEVLLQFRGERFYYIYTFSHIPARNQVLNHMKFLNEKDDVIEQTAEAFQKAQIWFQSFYMEKQLILDPGFGFSKTFEQNWQLIHKIDELAAKTNLDNPWLIGLSKKSFLKKTLSSESLNLDVELEALHLKCITEIKNKLDHQVLFRVHSPEILQKLL